jgi:hypothetical protein
MAMKKKKTDKNQNPQSVNLLARKTAHNSTIPAPSRPALAGVVSSVGTLLGRTRAYILSMGKAEA